MASDERLQDLEKKYEGYKVYDSSGEKIGKVDDLFVDENDREEYIGVKTGFFGLKSTLIPMDVVRVNERDRTLEVSETRDRVKDAPSFDDDEDITPEFEDRIRRHFGTEGSETSSSGSYGGSSDAGTAGGAAGGAASGVGSGVGSGAASEQDTTRGSGQDTTRGSGMDRDTDDYRELDRESSGQQSVGREEYRNREDLGEGQGSSSGASGTRASGGMSGLETGEQGGGGASGERLREEAREGAREGAREAVREELGRGGSGGTDDSGSMTGEERGRQQGDREGADREGASGSSAGGSGEESGGGTRVWRLSRN